MILFHPFPPDLYIFGREKKIQEMGLNYEYMRSEPSDGSSQVGRFLVGVERPGRRREIRVVEEQSSVAADAFQLVVVGRMVPGASDAGSTGRSAGSSTVRRRLFIGPIPIG